jgi:hypothetical protein
MQLIATVLLFSSLSVPSQSPPAPTAAAAADTWEALTKEYDLAFEHWVKASQTGEAGAESLPRPAGVFWARFEAEADRGEGRATLWLLANASSLETKEPALWAGLLARVERGGDAEWVGSALFELGANAGSFAADELVAYLDERCGPAHPKDLRVFAGLALAQVIATEDAPRAAELRVWAALLLHENADVAPGERLPAEDVDELGKKVLAAVDKESRAHFELAYRLGPDDVYYPRVAAPPDPKERWQPVIEELALQGCARARLWVLQNAPWNPDAAAKQRLVSFLETVVATPLSEEDLGSFGYEIGGLVQRLGLAAVEPLVRKLVEASPEASRAGLLFGLGDAVCESAQESDAAQRERGIEILGEVRERWPTSDAAKRADGRIFRYTNLVVGKTCPDFETVDADGNAFKLSDYRGKVTVVDFWGFW